MVLDAIVFVLLRHVAAWGDRFRGQLYAFGLRDLEACDGPRNGGSCHLDGDVPQFVHRLRAPLWPRLDRWRRSWRHHLDTPRYNEVGNARVIQGGVARVKEGVSHDKAGALVLHKSGHQ